MQSIVVRIFQQHRINQKVFLLADKVLATDKSLCIKSSSKSLGSLKMLTFFTSVSNTRGVVFFPSLWVLKLLWDLLKLLWDFKVAVESFLELLWDF